MKLGVATAALALLFLAGCGPADKPAADAAPTAIKSASMVCNGLPDFALLYVDAAVAACSKGPSPVRPNHESGTVVYTTKTPPAELLQWYKDQSEVKGLTPALSNDSMYSARDGEKRTMMVLTSAKDGVTRVTLNWGHDLGA
jgi:hypothetical protein